MNDSLWTLLIILLVATYVISVDGNPDTNQERCPFATLPLTLLHASSSYFYPEHIEEIVTNDDGVLCYGTKFSSWFDREKTHTQIFFCPPETSVSSNDFLYPKLFKENDILQCATEPNPLVEKKTRKYESGQIKDAPCGLANKIGTWYNTGYKVYVPETPEELDTNPTNGSSEFMIFGFCYDEQNKEVLYTVHLIRSPAFLIDNRLKYEHEKTFDISTEGYKSFGTIYQNEKTIYEQLANSEQSEYTSQWLVPPEDLVFALWKKTAYHYLNKKPIREDQLKLWNYINDCVQRESVKSKEEFTIYTAAMVLSEKEIPSYVAEPIEKPDVWVKIVYNFHPSENQIMFSGLAIIMNSNLNEDSWNKFYHDYCNKNVCENVFNERFSNAENPILCCHPYPNLQKLFHTDFLISDTLEINFSSDISPDEGNRDVTTD